jgi:mono/diheme cytochrome c family protein
MQILSQNCTACHTASSGPGNVTNLTNVNHLISSGLVVPGNPAASLLYTIIQSGRMPTSGALSAANQEIIRAWIAGNGTPSGGGTPTNPGPSPSPAPTASPSPDQPQALQIISQSCTGCHGATSGSAGVYGLTDVNHLIQSGLIVPGQPAQSFLFTKINSGAMPPGNPLSAANQEIIRQWILSGAPQGSAPPPPPPVPAKAPTYSYIQSQILGPNCAGCHYTGSAKGGYAFDKYTNVFKAVNVKLPTESDLYKVPEDGEMPPRPNRQLSSEELSLILQWIKKGAPND